jgi:hypothetical protein
MQDVTAILATVNTCFSLITFYAAKHFSTGVVWHVSGSVFSGLVITWLLADLGVSSRNPLGVTVVTATYNQPTMQPLGSACTPIQSCKAWNEIAKTA